MWLGIYQPVLQKHLKYEANYIDRNTPLETK